MPYGGSSQDQYGGGGAGSVAGIAGDSNGGQQDDYLNNLTPNIPELDQSLFTGSFDGSLKDILKFGPMGLLTSYSPFDDQVQMTTEDWNMVNPSPDNVNNFGGDNGSSIFNTPATSGGGMAQGNIFSQTTPFGGINYSTDAEGNRLAEKYLSPELQSLFTKQFEPGGYDSYGDDYMADARRRLDPIYERQGESFRQRMANRGQPVGGELYDDTYGNLMEAQNRGWESAAFGAKGASERARLQDWNRLASAMGLSTVQAPQDALNTEQFKNMMNINKQNISAQEDSDMWNTITGLGSAWITGHDSEDDEWWT